MSKVRLRTVTTVDQLVDAREDATSIDWRLHDLAVVPIENLDRDES